MIKKLLLTLGLALSLALPVVATAQVTTVGGGTGSTSPSGILYGVTGNLHLQTLRIGTGLTFTGTTLNASATGASTTLLTDSNTFSGTINKFTNAPALGVTGLLKGNGSSAITAAINGTDFTLLTAKTCTAGDFVSAATAAGVFTCTTPSAGGTPGGLNAQIQYNNAGVFGGITGATTDGTAVSLSGAHLLNPTINGAGAGLATLTYPNTASSVTITFPATTNTLATLAGTEALTNKSVNGVTLTAAGSATAYLNGTGAYTTPAGSTYTGTYPVIVTGNVISSGFSTTTNSGMAQGFQYVGSGGIFQTAASSSFFGFTPISGNQTITLSGVVTGSGATAITTAFGSQSAGVLGNPATGNTAVQATSTLYGAVQPGKVLAGVGTSLQYVATTTDSCGTGVTCTYSGGVNTFSIANGAITNVMLASTYTTAVSIASANGFAGTSSGGATPALTLSTTITGVLKGNGTAISAAANGTDFSLITANTCSAGQFFQQATAAGVFTCGTPTGGSAFPFTPSTTFGVNTSATSTPIWARSGIFASSTSQIASTTFAINGNVGIASTSPGYIFSVGFTPAVSLAVSSTSVWSSGTNTYTVPAGTVKIVVEVWGGGGGGGPSVGSGQNGGTGGGAGGFVKQTITTLASSYSMTIATGGQNGGFNAGGAAGTGFRAGGAGVLTSSNTGGGGGGSTSFGTIVACGGGGGGNFSGVGMAASGTSGGAGGNGTFLGGGGGGGCNTVGSDGSGNTGGAGGTGGTTVSGTSGNGGASNGAGFGGGGGSAAGLAGNGANGGASGASSPGVGASGSGGAAAGANGAIDNSGGGGSPNSAGGFPAAGGSGGTPAGGNGGGGSGGNGEVIVYAYSYVIGPPPITFGSAGNVALQVQGSGGLFIGTSTTLSSTPPMFEVATQPGLVAEVIEETINGIQYMVDEIDAWGHLVTSGPAPAITSCGTTPTVSGNDTNGFVTTSGTVNNCTITFANAYTNKPDCTFAVGSAVAAGYTGTGAAITLSFGTAIGTAGFSYICQAHQ